MPDSLNKTPQIRSNQPSQSIQANQQLQSSSAIYPDQPDRSPQGTPQSIIHPITAQSFAIIDQEIGEHSFTAAEYAIVRRVIHTTADFEFKNLIKFTPNAIENGIKALKSGQPIVVDVGMVKQGITGLVNKTFGNEVINALDYADLTNPSSDVDLDLDLDLDRDKSLHDQGQYGDRVDVSPEVTSTKNKLIAEAPSLDLTGAERLSKKNHIKPQTTRSGRGMYICAKQHPDAIFVVGNAPTALLSLCRLAQRDPSFKPSLVIGVPVGFVSVVESKMLLTTSRLSHIRSDQRKGGSPVAAAILNALITLAW
ncbi:precorrin-8X methylmutase [Thalassoporum mexicanum PCC 7367]|uniref:precorrin-8X methylmutase n=1 Tax=Thalassoporum mexicanum TaxID=3457544 RepID=UPI00029F8BAE|nr:precorrin-8X methylmutase [Pseudanabaena sp. PCC 7367]AFY70302.1 precorrin-8X methylmutase [Pseudanabaena sp. PCC 7367]